MKTTEVNSTTTSEEVFKIPTIKELLNGIHRIRCGSMGGIDCVLELGHSGPCQTKYAPRDLFFEWWRSLTLEEMDRIERMAVEDVAAVGWKAATMSGHNTELRHGATTTKHEH